MRTSTAEADRRRAPPPRLRPDAGGRIHGPATVAVLAVLVFAVYRGVLDAPFVFDDVPAIVKNPSIVRLWPLVGDGRERGPLAPPPEGPTALRPLANWTLAVNYAAGGLAPRGYHFVDVALHVLVAAVLAALVRRTLLLPYLDGAWEGTAGPVALAVAAVWAVHPLASEAVAYVTQRTEELMALFYLTTLWAAVRYWTAGAPASRAAWAAVAGVACVAGVASKETMVTAPVAVLLFERTFVGHGARRSWPLYAALAPGALLALGLNLFGVRGPTSDVRHHVALVDWWVTQARTLFIYLKLVVWPWPLSIHYSPAYLTLARGWPWVVAAATLAGATAVLAWRRHPAGFVAAVVAMVLAPTFLVPVVKMVAAERRMYLPLAGLVAVAVVGAYRVLARRAGLRSLGAAAAVIVVALGVVTARRLHAYESPVALWRDAARHQPDDAMSHYNLGVALVEAGRSPEEAIAEFEAALRLEPDHTGALDNLGMVLHRLGRPGEAEARFEQALALEPDDAVAHNDLGAVLITLGRPEEALDHLRRALVLQPDEPKEKVHLNLGKALMETGRSDEARAHLEHAVALAPDDADARYSLGVLLANAGRAADAIAQLEAAIRAKPDDAEAYNALCGALLRAGRSAEAVDRCRRALAIDPAYVEAHNTLGAALLDLGRRDAAIDEFRAALRLRPDQATARYNLARALVADGRPAEAVDEFQAALRVRPDDAQTRFECALAYAASARPAEAVAMAEEARATASAHGDVELADAIAGWLASRRGR